MAEPIHAARASFSAADVNRIYCGGGAAATTGMVTMLLVNTFCAIHICVRGFVGSVSSSCSCT